MTDFDHDLKDHYERQNLDPAVMDRLLAMEDPPASEAAPETAPPPRRNRLPLGLALAATALITVGMLGATVTSSVVLLGQRSPDSVSRMADTGMHNGDAVAATQPPAEADADVDADITEGKTGGDRAGRFNDQGILIIQGDGRSQPIAYDLDRLTTPQPNTVRNLELTDRDADAVPDEGGYLDNVDGFVAETPVQMYRVQSATPTRIDPLSTFAMDVDTASWTRTRNALARRSGLTQVRTEEFINAFRYDYAPPTDGFAVSTEVVPSPFSTERHLLRIGVQAEKVSIFDRKPVHLTFLVDVSGSMNGPDRLGLLKIGLKKLVEELQDGDTVAIATYSGTTGVALEPTPVDSRRRILAAIDGLGAGGSTAMGAGIDLAYDLAERTLQPGHINRVIVASDGDANVGIRDGTALASLLRKRADQGITLTTLGFGQSRRGDLVMESLANKGDGQYHFIANERDAHRVLVEELTGTLQVVARDAKIQVDFDPARVKEWRQIGYENRRMADRDFRNDAKDAGEVGAGHQVTALYEVLLTGQGPLGEVRLRWEAPGREVGEATERAFALDGPLHESFSAASTDTRVAVVAGTFAECLKGSPCLPASTLDDVLPVRPEYAERDGELRAAIANAKRNGLLR